MLFLVSYDLRKDDRQDYKALWEALDALGASRVLRSQWIVRAPHHSPDQLQSYFLPLIDSDDGILIIPVDTWASQGTMVDVATL